MNKNDKNNDNQPRLMGFYPAMGKKNQNNNDKKRSLSRKHQLAESEKSPSCAFFLGDYHFYRSRLKVGRCSVSDLKKKKKEITEELAPNLLKHKLSMGSKIVFGQQALFYNLPAKPNLLVVNFTADRNLYRELVLTNRQSKHPRDVNITTEACAC